VSEHTIKLAWKRTSPDFDYDTYNRTHVIAFGDIGKICASASPEFHGDPQCLDPEQAFVMSLSSCHMLTFLAVASKKGFVVDEYLDFATAELGKNKDGKLAVVKIVLKPEVAFNAKNAPAAVDFRMLHDRAHKGCIIANSIPGCIEMVIEPTMQLLDD
jgi:organic hydroperoxide reductase OsmC/OhrA